MILIYTTTIMYKLARDDSLCEMSEEM